jgi:predicted site-specific integrase-resolvase
MAKIGRPRKPKTTVVYARISKDLERQLRDESEREHRQLSATIGFILEKYFERREVAA